VLFKNLLSKVIDSCIFFCVADSGLLQLSAFQCENDVVIASLQNLNKNYHLFVFEKINAAALPLGRVWIFKYHPTDLVIELGKHILVKVTI